jgi:hypothetical protein
MSCSGSNPLLPIRQIVKLECAPSLPLSYSFFSLRQYSGTLQRHCTENSKQIFPEIKLRGLVPNFHIHVSVSLTDT